MPIPKAASIPAGLIVEIHALMSITSSMSPVPSRYFAEHAPELASNRPPATAAERADAAESVRGTSNDTEDERGVAAMVLAIRRRQRERTAWLLDRDLVGGAALEWARQFE